VTSVLDTAPDETVSSRATVTPRDAWRKARLPVLIGLGFVVLALVQALVTGGIGEDRLDPEAAGTEGGMALAVLLRDHGVDVRRVEEPSGASGVTVFVPVPRLALLNRPAALRKAATATDVVVASPDEVSLEMMRIDAGVAGHIADTVLQPGCEHPDALAAGAVRMGGAVLAAPETATACYADRGDATFVDMNDGGRRVTLLGSESFMTNEHLDDDGNAALALRLLTRNRTVEWVYPRTVEFAAEEQKGLFDLLPHRVFVAVAQAFVVLLLLALWRARRLGPVVVEPLPVVVRAAEAVEGRARLYEAAHARDQAANALRAGLRDRLVRALGLAADAGPDTLVAAVTARSGRDALAVTGLLYGPPPADDAALVRLATDLDLLDTEVRAL
jgi:hypothetical protein